MRNNVDGIELAYRTIFASAIEARDSNLAAEIQAKIEELKAAVDVAGLKSLDPDKLRAASEEMIIALQMAAPAIGLRAPSLEEIAQ